MNITSALAGWHDFYVTAGSAAAALVGLLFVGLSLHIKVVVGNPDVRGLARMTLTSFLAVLLVALVILSPLTGYTNLALWLLVLAVVSAGIGVGPSIDALRHRKVLTLRDLFRRVALSVLCYVALAVAGIMVMNRDLPDALNTLLVAVVALLVISVRNTWDLLVTVAAKNPADI